MREQFAFASSAFGGSVDDALAQFEDARGAEEFLAGSAEEIRLHLDGDAVFLSSEACRNREPHRQIGGGHEDGSTNDTAGAQKFGTKRNRPGAFAVAMRVEREAVALVEDGGGKELLEVGAGERGRQQHDHFW